MKANKRIVASDADYEALAQFRHHIRLYLQYSDQAARDARLEPRQYQLLLAMRGMQDKTASTVGDLALQLQLRHHSTVELIDRAESNGLVRRKRSGSRVMVRLTPKGSRVLAKAVEKRLQEIQVAGPVLVRALQSLIRPQAEERATK